MNIAVEPLDGPALDRLITALLNATGVCHRLVDSTPARPGSDPAEVIGAIASRLRRTLAGLAEHNGDEELEHVTCLLAEATLLVAADLGLEHLHRADRPPYLR